MKINKSYKYINLLIRFVIGAIAVYFIYFRIAEDFFIDFYKIETKNIDLFILGIVLILMFLNWGIEAVKWRFTIRNIEEISIFKSFKLIFTGITLGFLTPNRIGEIPARALLLNGSNVKEITLKT
ncbi:MAG: lysylphosphatidylglycerol synthase domain-containing protein, partial [Vicingaceae bacterium]